MRTVGTGKVRLRQVKTYGTDLAVTSLNGCGVHDPQICPNIKLKAVNEIHSLMMTFTAHLTLYKTHNT